ncbi:MAG TPA: triose-phosphate isomerase [Planctomycetota bacterium]|nr:triose-phosphate isomerase [Planctomycetota bacterium]
MPVSRKPYMVGNWKMNKLPAEAVQLAQELRKLLEKEKAVDIGVAPTFLAIPGVVAALKGSVIGVGGQNIHPKDSGAYTGEISAPMLKAAGCGFTIIGHSERRQYFGETDATVNEKLFAALGAGLDVILCIGETLEQREAGRMEEVVRQQLSEGLKDLPLDKTPRVTIAYEPVWAIGTGVTATPQQAQEAHAFIRSVTGKVLQPEVAQAMRIQYGGSVKPNNIKELMDCPDIDGALVGGAALTADGFAKIVKF